MTEIESGDVMDMRDVSFSELLDEINSKTKQTRMSAGLSWTAIAAGVVAGFATGGPGLLLCAVALPAWAFGKWLDSYRRTTVLYYDLEGDAEAAYGRLVEGFDRLAGCAAKWHIESGGAVQSLTAWKRNAGASHLVTRKLTNLTYNLPAVIKSNVTPPALHVGKQVMFFMPDIVLVQKGSQVGAVNYADLNVGWQESRFIETERVPRDASVVDHTWRHPNKSGGPDRRFKDNRQIPVCQYEAMHLTSASGVNELVQFSRTGLVAAFVNGCRMLAALPRERTVALSTVLARIGENAAPATATEKKGKPLKAAVLAVLGLLIVIPVLAVVFGPSGKKADPGLPLAPVAEISNASFKAENATTLPEENRADPAPQVTQIIATGDVQPGKVTNQEAEQTTMLYTKTAVNLRAGPGTEFAVITVVPEGNKVLVVEVNGAWSQVRVSDELGGWMANSTISER